MANKENNPEIANNDKEKATTSSTVNKSNSKPFWKKHFLSLFLLLGLIIAIVWGLIVNNNLEKTHQAKVEQLNVQHKEAMDSIVQEKAKIITSTLALAVRSELIDENKDQVNQYFLQMIKNEEISRLILVNQTSGRIIMSTNKKDEGMQFGNETLLGATNVISINTPKSILTATPVMGLNSQMATLIVETTK